MIYFKISMEEDGPYYVVPLEEAQADLAIMRDAKEDSDDEQKCTFEAVDMTEEEFEALPDFEGF